MKSIFLTQSNWDLTLDAANNIAACFDPYRMAQDVSCAIKTFIGELYFDNDWGVSQFESPVIPLIQKQYEDLALTVSGVTFAQCIINSIDRANRKAVGYVILNNDLQVAI
jgi:hypothetical protein